MFFSTSLSLSGCIVADLSLFPCLSVCVCVCLCFRESDGVDVAASGGILSLTPLIAVNDSASFVPFSTKPQCTVL